MRASNDSPPLLSHALSHALVTAPNAAGAAPDRWMLFVHGVFGSGGNFRTFARRFCEARPSWGAVLVDLRLHGASLAVPGPHSVPAAAADLVRLGAALPGPVGGILGHSLGGKIALEYVRQREGALSTAWILDSTPGLRPSGSDSIEHILRTLRDVGPVVPTRQAFVASFEEAGVSRETAQWLAMNLRADGDAYRFRLDLDAIRELLDDYWLRDLWPVVEAPPGEVTIELVIGGRSATFSPADRARAFAAEARAAGRVHCHVLENAGHWVHVDDPEGLFALVCAGTPA